MTEIIYGRWASLETLRAGRRTIQQLTLAEGMEEKGIIADLIAAAYAKNVPVRYVNRRMMDDVAKNANHQGVVLRASDYPYVEMDKVLETAAENKEKPFLLILDLLQDPQNVGTLLRVADSVGVHGVVMQERRGVGVTASVSNASAGAVEHLNIVQVNNLVNAMRELKKAGVWMAGMDIGQNIAPIDRVDLNIPLAIVLGSEGEGIRRLVRDTCDMLITLPMRGHVGSLNVATVGSVALYAAWQARAWAGWAHSR